MGDGTKENPFTREDVQKKIEEHNGTARYLDLSDKTFEEGIDLSELDLEGIVLRDARFPTHFEGQKLVGAKFNGSNLNRADFRNINLQYAQFGMLNKQPTRLEGADLRSTILLNANFQCADLSCAKFGKVENENFRPATLENTDFRKANLFLANFIGCYFYGTKLEGAYIRGADIYDAHLEEADWGSYVAGEEKKGEFYFAEYVYRRLKMWYTRTGLYDIAGEFFYREMEVKRTGLSWLKPKKKRWLRWGPLRGERVRLNVYRWLYGYGERPWRVVIWGGIVLFGLALIYFFFRGVAPHTLTVDAFLNSLYYSAVSFTALGYGPWFNASSVRSWVQGFGAAEAIIGVFAIALFLVTFTRKTIR